MKPSTDSKTDAVMRLLDGLHRLDDRPDPSAGDLVATVLDRAGLVETPDEERAGLDATVIAALKRSRRRDAMLRHVGHRRLLDLLERMTARLATRDTERPDLRVLAWDLLDLVRRPGFLGGIDRDDVDTWSARLLALVEASDLTVGPLFRQRARWYGSKPLFAYSDTAGLHTRSWRQAAARVELYARGLHSLGSGEKGDGGGGPGIVAVLADNDIETALVDLACLTSGLVNVPVPANATEADIVFILRHCGAGTLIARDAAALRAVSRQRETLPKLKHLITMEPTAADPGVLTLDDLAAASRKVPAALPRRRGEEVAIDDLATIMYTSGTTGNPKGIRFSHRNVVFKRFARALALPEIGEDDVFLCLLPLYHTFGRFLEMLGCVFWGATYCFLGGTSAEALLRGMRLHRPTVFISVPKKWMQLHEATARLADLDEAADEELLEATRQVTGGKLRWGLSAAGYLAPDVFRFFQRQGVELLSGFGMTEATGGITMTAPGEYREGSLGKALPGIEVRLADDGELLVRGPYVMMGYMDPPAGEIALNEDGWFHTGDLMQADDEGHLRLVDRKKEIYKNLRGETIAPQRVENLFLDFESVSRAFLVGDHRDYNTLLIYPDPEYAEQNFATRSTDEIREHFRSLVVSANKFLSPYERIVDFAIIDRDLDAEQGELTTKGTPRRTVIERNFAEVVQGLYRRASLRVGEVELMLPNWLFQILGLTARDIEVGEDRIVLRSSGAGLTVQRMDASTVRIGSCLYGGADGPLNLGLLMTSPRLWLGNDELVQFVPLDAATRRRRGRSPQKLRWAGDTSSTTAGAIGEAVRRALDEALEHTELDLDDLHLAARLLASPAEGDALHAMDLLQRVLDAQEGPLLGPALALLHRLADAPWAAVRRRAFQALVPAERDSRFTGLLGRFLEPHPDVLDADSREVLSPLNLPESKIEAFIRLTHRVSVCPDLSTPPQLARNLLQFLAAYGAAHPVRYRRLRAFLTRMSLFATRAEIRDRARDAAEELRIGFRRWLGPPAQIAVDPETGQEYRWNEVVAFDDVVDEASRRRLKSAIEQTAFLREAVFLFSTGVLIRLSDIPPAGVWIRVLGSRHGKSVYRITVQTRFQGSYELAVNCNEELSAEQVQEEIDLLTLCGDPTNREPLVEDFGGFWPEPDLWSEEFIAGATLEGSMRRLARRPGGQETLSQLWPFLAWSALAAYVDFWERSGRRLEIADPDRGNVVVPTEDYQTGARLVSVSRRRPHTGLLAMMKLFRDDFVAPAEATYPELAGRVDWEILFSSVFEIVGESEAAMLFSNALKSERLPRSEVLRERLSAFLERIRDHGFVPVRLHFAIERYRRWSALSADATSQARALTLQELYETYGLLRLAGNYPEVRVRFFRETVFAEADPGLADGLDAMVAKLRAGELSPDALIDAVDELEARLDLGDDDKYFLARLSYPYLHPEVAAGIVHSDYGGKRQSEIVVALEDREGQSYRVRHALNPKEVERLHGLFVAAKLDVRFDIDHHYVVAINERGQIIAGLYYELNEAEQTAHMEKIVVHHRHRQKGVADGLMHEFFNRLRAAGVRTLTTGFFRPEYFYGFGFRIEKRYAGLVKDLNAEGSELH